MKQIALLLPFALGWTLACAQPAFVDLATQAGIAATGQNYGIAIADYDGDGYDDLYVTRRDGPNLLYHNLGNLQFEEVAGVAGVANAGVSSCAVWGDFDNDGWPDLLVTDRDADNVLYHNNGDGTFTDITAQAGVAEGSKVRAALTADVNGDGWLDIYLARLGLENKLYLNNGDGTFTDYTAASGALDDQISMGAVFFDYDNDGDPDLYLTHDAHQPYILYQNDGTGHFTDVSEAAGVNYAGQGMGVCTGDINHDGWLDIYITNLSFNTLYLNNGDGTFTDISDAAGVTDPGMGWGCTFLDYDNDTWPDIYMANDSYFSPLPNVLYRNRGDLTFENISEGTPLASMFAGYAVAVADFDHNGSQEIVLANAGTDGNQLFALQDGQPAGNWFQIRLRGTTSNRMAIGARVRISSGGATQVQEVSGGSGYASQNSQTLHFGLGDATQVDEVVIHWPSGLTETYTGLSANKIWEAIEGEGITTAVCACPAPRARLSPPVPNPVTGDEALLVLELTRSAAVHIEVYDALGRRWLTREAGILPEGTHRLYLPAGDLPQGTYFIHLRAADFEAVQPMVKW